MPKELFNQTLLQDPVEPDDLDRIGLGQPSVAGGKNITWGYFKTLIASVLDIFSSDVKITDPTDETLDGITTTQRGFNVEATSAIFQLRNAIKDLAGAFISVDGDPLPQTVTTTEQTLTITENIPSTNTDVIELDSANNIIIVKAAGIYQFSTFLNISNSSNNFSRDFTIRSRNNDTNAIITERTITVPSTGYSASSSPPAIQVLESDLPLPIRITKESSDINDLNIQVFNTNFYTGANAIGVAGLASIAEPTNAAIRAITGYANGNDVFNYLNGFLYEFDETLTDADDNDNYLKPDDILVGDPGRWVKVQDFALKSDIVASIDYENIFFEEVAPDDAKVVRGFDFKIPIGGVSEYGGISTILTSADIAYTLGDTVSAGDYLKVTNDTQNARTVLIIEAV